MPTKSPDAVLTLDGLDCLDTPETSGCLFCGAELDENLADEACEECSAEALADAEEALAVVEATADLWHRPLQ